ncbi:MAG TPA: redoxin domain-containing protein [Pyrinomonadaceae bacterium]|nr:redoxin domain-containing protein [Pyrinomonadaceae bacterium]
MDTFLLLLRLTLFGIFALAGVAKFLDLKGSEKAFKDFGIPDALAKPSSIALSVFEILIALLFLSVETAWYGAIGAAALLFLFIGQMIYQMAKGRAPDCHCFGQLHSAPVGKLSVARNIMFGAVALFLVYRGPAGQGMSLNDPGLDIMQLAFGVIFIGFLIAVVFYLKKISEQQIQIMRRIELMELISRDGGEVEREHIGHPHEGLPIGAVVPDFELPDLSGAAVSLAALRTAKKPILFFFVSPTCKPCEALVPEFAEWQRELKDKVKFVFLSSGTAEDNVAKFGGEGANVVLLQNGREVAEQVKAKWTPTALLMDANGRVASHAAAGDTAIRTLIEQIKAEDLTREFAHFANLDGHTHANKIGEPVPEFTLSDIKGNQISSDFFRNKPTLVAFWSRTCPHCVEMMKELREWDKVKGQDQPNLVVFSDSDLADHEEFHLKSPIVLDEGHKTAGDFGMFGTPSAVLVNEDGRIVSETAVGAPDIWALVGKKR